VRRLKTRNDIQTKYKWDLSLILKDNKEFDSRYNNLKEEIVKIEPMFKGRLDNKDVMLKSFKHMEKLTKELYELFMYSHLKSDENTADSECQKRLAKVETLAAEFEINSSFMTPELVAIGEEKINKYMNENEELKEYEHFFDSLFNLKEHVLSEKEELLLSNLSEIIGSEQKVFSMLDNADVDFSDIEIDGEVKKLNQSNFVTYLKDDNRELREKAFKNVYKFFESHKNTIAATYNANLKSDKVFSKIKKFNSTLDSELKGNKIPEKVYTNLVDTVNENLHLLHRYMDLKKKFLKLDKMYTYDLYVPLIKDVDKKINYDEGVEIVKTALKPLGKEYLTNLNKAFDERWIDVYYTEGKRSGAYSSGSYTTKPYILLNYEEDINSVSTLAHELGHSMHSNFSNTNQPYVYSDYPIFTAEIASTVNETFLIKHLLKNTEDKNEKMYLLNDLLESFRATLFRQTKFAEFEYITHSKIENGEELSTEDFANIYEDLIKKYYGDALEVDEFIKYEWSRIPHFYNSFYVYQYATGFSAALAFYKNINEDGQEALNKYLNLLKSGSKDYPINLLKKAGVDMENPKTIENALSVFEETLNEFEELLK